jgi:hypothetical protein
MRQEMAKEARKDCQGIHYAIEGIKICRATTAPLLNNLSSKIEDF